MNIGDVKVSCQLYLYCECALSVMSFSRNFKLSLTSVSFLGIFIYLSVFITKQT